MGGYLEVQPEHGLVNFQQERFQLIATGARQQSLFLQGLFQGACEGVVVYLRGPCRVCFFAAGNVGDIHIIFQGCVIGL